MSDKRIPIVDSDDNVIGVKSRKEITLEDTYRVSGLWITDKEGRILLARRAYIKSNSPGMWGPAVAGTVEEGETYLSNIIKEAKEELGLEIGIPQELHKEKSYSRNNYFGQWFGWSMDDQTITPEEREVAEVKWFTKEEIAEAVDRDPAQFLNGMKFWIEKFKEL